MVQLHDLTLRDAHQSLLATRMRTEDMLEIAERRKFYEETGERGAWAEGIQPDSDSHRFNHLKKQSFQMVIAYK